MELDEEEDAAVYEHLYDDKPFLLTKMVNGPSYRRWKLPLPVRGSCSKPRWKCGLLVSAIETWAPDL